jgi:hypothetical protein
VSDDREGAVEAATGAVEEQQEQFFNPGSWSSTIRSTALALTFGGIVFAASVWSADPEVWDTPDWPVLLALLVAQAGLWGLFCPRVWDWFDDVEPLADAAKYSQGNWIARAPYRLQSLVASCLIALAVYGLAIGTAERLEPARTGWAEYGTALALAILGFVILYPVVLVVRACHVATRLAVFEPEVAGNLEPRVVLGAQQLLTRRLSAVLATIGTLLTVLVLAIGATVQLANALRLADARSRGVTDVEEVETIPSSVVVLFGVALTGVLALIYLPTHVRLASVRRIIVDSYCPLGYASNDDLDRRAKMTAEIGETASGIDTLQRSAVIVGPLLAGLGSAFLNT